jgi:acyl-CoA synthetase (AMP-forming)/AMP-acid ligase II
MVAIYLPRNNLYLASIFGTWKSNNHYLPLNQSWPAEATRNILRDARPDLIISDTDAFEDIAPTLSCETAPATEPPTQALLAQWESDSCDSKIAYVIYTSGSTGDQKGVVISRRSLASYIAWVERTLGEHRNNRSLLINGELSFDISLADIAFALAFETEIHVSPDPRNMLKHVQMVVDRQIDTFYGVPSTLNRLFSWVEKRKAVSLSGLRTIFSGGDILTASLVDLLGRVVPDAVCYNMYGPTELTMNCLYLRVEEAGSYAELGAVPTGREFSHLEYLLIDPESSAPQEGEGELVVYGDQCMEGYLNDAEATEQAFVVVDGARYYRTGDLFSRDARGIYTILGRVDAVVKVQGYRVNTNMIDGVLSGESYVREAKTITLRSGVDVQIVTFVSFSQAPDDFESVLYAICRTRLPRYMVPSRIVELPELPQGGTGKIDTQRLEAIALEKPPS